jgi:hypothetical protein
VYVVWLNFKELLGMIWIVARRSYLGRCSCSGKWKEEIIAK